MMTYEDAERILCNQCIHNVHCMIHDEECEPMKRLKQPRVGEWKRTAEEKPDYTRHVIITYGSSRHASKYGYYFKKEDKWYRDHRCIEEIEPPYAWTEMPEVPDEFICGVCCG